MRIEWTKVSGCTIGLSSGTINVLRLKLNSKFETCRNFEELYSARTQEEVATNCDPIGQRDSCCQLLPSPDASIFQSTPHAAIDFRAALSLVVKDLRLFSYSAENRNSSLAINSVQGHALKNRTHTHAYISRL